MDYDIVPDIVSQLRKPSTHLLKAAFIQNAVNQNDGGRATVIQFGDATESLLTGGVPDLEPYNDAGINIENSLRHK